MPLTLARSRRVVPLASGPGTTLPAMPISMDEYPLHQAPLSLQYPATSDRNAYDRCYFNAHDRTGDIFLVTGLGYYPNLGTMDAYATVRRGDRQHTVRISDAISDDRLNQQVGPYRIEVVEPLNVIRVVCDADDHGLGFDLTGRVRSPWWRSPTTSCARAQGHPRRLPVRPGGLVERHPAPRRRGDRRHRRRLAGHP